MAAREGWRYFATRFDGAGGEEIIDLELPITSPSLTKVLSGPRQMTCSIPFDVPRLVRADGTPLLQRWGTGIYAEDENEQIRGGGFLVDYSIEPDGSLSLDISGPTTYLKDMPYTASDYWIDADPLDIYRAAWAHVQSQAGGNAGILIDPAKSPVRIGTQLENVDFVTGEGERVAFEAGPYKMNWYTTDDIGGKMDTLAKDTPFDYLETSYWEGDRPRHLIQLGYPEIGVRREELRFVLGENVFQIPSRAYAGSAVASEVQVLGTGEGRDKKRGYATRAPSGHLRRVLQVDDGTLKSQADVQRRAAQELQAATGVGTFSELVVKDHDFARIGTFDVGDEILYAEKGAWGTVEDWVRITKITEEPESSTDIRLSVIPSGRVAA